MEIETTIDPLKFTKVELVVLGCVLPANLIKVDQRSLFRAIFDEGGWILKDLPKILDKKLIKLVNNTSFYLKIKSTILFLTI